MRAGPRLLDNLVINDDAEVTTVLDNKTGRVFLTNKTGQIVLGLCSGDRDLDGIVAGLEEMYPDRSKDDLRNDVLSFLKVAAKKGVIDWEEGQ